jgi:sulfate adenylyltransferase
MRAAGLKKIPLTTRETGDLIMMGIGAFTPIEGFMGYEDWQGVCNTMSLPSQNNLFWPIPITLSTTHEIAASLQLGEEVALWDIETASIVGTMRVNEKAQIDKAHECRQVFKTTDPHHPGVEKVLAQGPINLGGPVKVLSEIYFPEMFAEIYQRPA